MTDSHNLFTTFRASSAKLTRPDIHPRYKPYATVDVVAAVAHVLNEKSVRARNSEQDLAGPLLRDMRGAHHQRRTGASLRENVDRAEGHERFSIR